MRWIAGFVVATACASAFAQEGLFINGKRVEVSAPTAVAVGVGQVFWKKDGSALAYYAKDADGTYLGVYDVINNKGRQMLRLPEGTSIHFEQWMPNKPVYLMLTSSLTAHGTKRYVVTSIDVRNSGPLEVWSEEYEQDAEVGFDVNTSPLLDHALITVTDPTGRHPIVLTEGAVNTVYSRDVATAWKQGMDFIGWSVDGSAYFGGGTPAPAQELATEVTTLALNQQSQGTIEFKIKVEGSVLESLPLIGFFWKIRPTAPGAGTPVHELMPRNGVLRPVLSRGPYVGPDVLPHVVWPKDEEAVVRSNERLDGTGAIWLVALTGQEEAPYGRQGVLVSGERGQSWMCEDGNWIAYEVAGALFVRRITYGGQAFSKALFGG